MPPSRPPLATKTESQVAKDDNSNAWRTTKADDDVDVHDSSSWRESDKPSSTKDDKSTKSYGISPQAFHNSKRRSRRDQQQQQHLVDMQSFHESVEEEVLHTQKREHMTRLAMQRSAFKQLSRLQTFPVQDMAMELYQELLEGRHLQSSQRRQGDGGEDPVSGESSATSGNSSVEAKRPMLSPESSPGKSQLKQQYLQEFETTDICQKNPLWSLQPRMFATEKANGKRKYLVGHFGRVVDLYWRKTAPENRHLYEVLVEKTPCHMYFDLEYSKALNPDIQEEPVLEELYLELAKEIEDHLDVKLERNMIIDLDSSNDTKFSRHWIVHLPGGLFADAVAVGRFIKRWIGRLATEVATQQLQSTRPNLSKYLFVQTKDPAKPTCIIDLGVYTRNRLFRCLGSRKFGKIAFLQISKENEYPIDLPSLQKCDDDTPTTLPKVDEIEKCDSPTATKTTLDEFVVANDWRQHANVLAETLVVPLERAENGHIFEVPDDESSAPTALASYRIFSNTKTVTKVIHQSTKNNTTQIRTATSQFPKLDQYVLEVLCTRGGVQGSIRACTIDEVDGVPRSITYQLNKNRYCEMIGRPHKSNNIYWTVDFKTWSCVQGCHDRECFGRSTPKPIPNDRLPEIRTEVQSWLDEQAFDQALANLDIDDLVNGKVPNAEEQGKENAINDIDNDDDDESFENALAQLDLDEYIDSSEKVQKIPQTSKLESASEGIDHDDDESFEQALANLDLEDFIGSSEKSTTREKDDKATD
jgi:hypothetical protein